MAFKRDSQPGGGGGFKRDSEKGFLSRVMDTMAESGKNVREAVMNPMQSIPDALRTSSDFITLGLNDRLRSAVKGTDYQAEKTETEAADTRLGSIDEALNLGAAVAAPSLAVKALPADAGLATRTALFGGEGAGLAGAEASIKGEPVLPAMAYGGMGGAGGAIAGDAIGSVANIFSKRAKPQFASDQELFDAAKSAHKGTREGKDLVSRADLVDQIRMAETKGKGGFKDLNTSIEGYGRDAMKVPREVHEGISKIAHKDNSKAKLLSGAGDVVSGGTSWGRLPVAMATKGLGPVAGTIMKVMAGQMDDVNPKEVQAIKDILLKGAGKDNPNMTPEMIETLRTNLAKIGAGTARQREKT